MGRVLNTTAPAARSAVRPAAQSKYKSTATARVYASKVRSLAAPFRFLLLRFLGAVPRTPMVTHHLNAYDVFVYLDVLIGVHAHTCHRSCLAVGRRPSTT